MTTIQDQRHDPRTYREPPKGVAQAPTKPQHIRCDGPVCEMKLDVSQMDAARAAGFVAAHGWVRGTKSDTLPDGKRTERPALFCSKRCLMLEALADASDKLHEQAPAKAPDAAREPSRATVKTTQDRNGDTVSSAKCDRWLCQVSFECAPTTDRTAIAKAAAANGFVETADGTFCSAQCASQVKAEKASGWEDPELVRPEAKDREHSAHASNVSVAPSVSRDEPAQRSPAPDEVRTVAGVTDLKQTMGPHHGIKPHPQNQRAKR
jgi:hypothetical protein